MATFKKPTGNPSIPPERRRAKRIAKSILGCTSAAVAGNQDNEKSEDGADEDEEDPTNTEKRKQSEEGVKEHKRRPGTRGVQNTRDAVENLVQYVGMMYKSVEKLVEDNELGTLELDKRVVEEVTKKVTKEMTEQINQVKGEHADVVREAVSNN